MRLHNILREAKEDQIQLAKLPYKMTELAPVLSAVSYTHLRAHET